MKTFFWTMLAVVAGIWIYSQVMKGKKTVGAQTKLASNTGGLFEGPAIDPITGAYTPPSAMVGTVGFPAQGN